MQTAKFKKQVRKIPFLCIGANSHQHQSNGDTFFMNHTGPYCYHCALWTSKQNRSIIEHKINVG